MTTIKARLREFATFSNLSIRSFEEKCGLNRGNISNMNEDGSIGSDKLSKILDTFPDLNPKWLITGSGTMTNDSKSYEIKLPTPQPISVTRPRIPFNAAAGSLSIAVDNVTEEECERLPLIPTLPDYDFTIQVRGDSMMPEFHSGDEVAFRFIDEASFIQWGLPHVLDTAQGVVLKSIYQDEDNIICKSFNSRYPDFSIPKDEILRMAIVVGFVRQS